MKLIERYIFFRLAGIYVLAFPALAVTIWLSQALPQLNQFSDRGQGLLLFLQITGLIFPSLMLMIAPITLQIAVTFAINGLNTDSELVTINAAGARRSVLLKPVLLLCILVAAFTAFCTVYLAPMTLGQARQIGTAANASAVGSVIREGKFRQINGSVTMYVRSRDLDGTIRGLFVFDPRDPSQSLTYIAQTAKLVENDAGTFLLLSNGVIQRIVPQTGQLNTIQFQSYVFDLSTLGGVGLVSDLYPQEQSIGYLLSPDPNDPFLRQNPAALTAELHTRLSAPLYAFAFGLIPLAILGRPRSNRRGTALASAAAWCTSLALRGVGLVLGGALPSRPELAWATYAVPLAGMVVPLWFIIGDRRLRLPGWLSRQGSRRIAQPALSGG